MKIHQNRRIHLISALLALPALACTAGADSNEQSPPPILEFKLARDSISGSTVELVNGIRAIPSSWPTLMFATFDKNIEGNTLTFRCTATLIGPNVVLTAAHCVDPQKDNAPSLKASVKIDGIVLPMYCDMHTEYKKKALIGASPRSSDDFALCILDDKGNPPETLKKMTFETVETKSVLAQGDPVLMTGYGCRELIVKNGRPSAGHADGLLRVADAVIDKPAGSEKYRPSYVTIRSSPSTEPALCPGDSGGPLFSGTTSKEQVRHRLIRGVNSSIAVDSGYFVSRIAATGTDSFTTWANQWLNEKATRQPKACGLNISAGDPRCTE